MADIDKNKVGAAFDKAAKVYDGLADFQQRICEKLAATLPALPVECILDGGCGTGNSAEFLTAQWPDAMVVGCDLSVQMLAQARTRKLIPVCSDLECLPFRDAGFDLLWSSLALQWCQPQLAYAELQRVLKPGGKLVFSTLTTGSLHELETAFDGVTGHRRVLPFASIDDVTASLHAVDFTNLQIRTESYATQHADFHTLLASIRGIGANQSGGHQRRGLMGKNTWQTAQARYEALRDGDDLLPLSYELLFVCAEKPAV